jgi:hypothetical protein
MHHWKFFTTSLLFALIFSILSADSAALTGPTAIQIILSAAHSTTSWDQRDPQQQKFELPLLTLHRQRQATSATERTLEVSIVGLPDITEIEIEIISHHENVITSKEHTETRRFVIDDHRCALDGPCRFQWTFDPTTTPSDLYTLRVKDGTGKTLWENPNRPAFALLDTWDVTFGDYDVRLTYATLFPFSRGPDDLDNRLSPEVVTDFVERQFVPIIRDTWRTQVEEWGFGQPFHPDWDADKVVEVFVTAHPFALFGGTGTYSRPMGADGQPLPDRRIWWRSSMANFASYDRLENAYKAAFAHEFFHLMQWNVRLSSDRPHSYWLNVFVEAQAALAASVQYPEIELAKNRANPRYNEYGRAANRFLTEQLNVSYKELEADDANRYDAVLYWRFLYEQYGGMAVVRVALEEMGNTRGSSIVGGMAGALDRAFAHLDGPFRSFEESLIAFARANYALRLENGRCIEIDLGSCGGRYQDPNEVYTEPALDAVLDYGGVGTADGSGIIHDGVIPSSYGMDFVDVRLDPTLQGQPLTIKVHGMGDTARFNVQIWQLGPGVVKPRAITPQPESVPRNEDGVHVYLIPQLDTTTVNRLALIITRLDPDETAEPAGSYSIALFTRES